MYMTYKENNGDYTINMYDVKDDYFFGYIDLFDNGDCYVITGRVNKFEVDAEIDLFETRKHKLHQCFERIQSMIKKGAIPLDENKPVLILDDELISRDAIRRMKLKRVPRYCGYYFI